MPPERVRKRRKRKAKPKAPPDFEQKKKTIKKTAEKPSLIFKSKSIVIPPQLDSSAAQGPTSHRKQSLQVLYSYKYYVTLCMAGYKVRSWQDS